MKVLPRGHEKQCRVVPTMSTHSACSCCMQGSHFSALRACKRRMHACMLGCGCKDGQITFDESSPAHAGGQTSMHLPHHEFKAPAGVLCSFDDVRDVHISR